MGAEGWLQTARHRGLHGLRRPVLSRRCRRGRLHRGHSGDPCGLEAQEGQDPRRVRAPCRAVREHLRNDAKTRRSVRVAVHYVSAQVQGVVATL